MSGYVFGRVLRLAMKGKSATQIERAFGIVVITPASVFAIAYLAQIALVG